MKKLITIVIFVCIVVLMPSVTYSVYDNISNFDAQIFVNKDSSITVQETIIYDFGDENRHGIYRDIPIQYKARGGNYKLRVSNTSVTDENGSAYNYEISYPGEYIRLKIGDADIYVTGEHEYVITYSVKRALNYFEEWDELYWNVTGNEWPGPIDSATATIYFEDAVASNDIKTDCFAGYLGYDDKCFSERIVEETDGTLLGIEFVHKNLSVSEGLTIVVGFPKGLVTPPTTYEKLI
ncbi:MAG: DUF2207 domain-containing protein, partial [Patescibacteria group bacterium]